MTKASSKHAIVIGAGMGGLLFARALSTHFQRVTMLERDTLPESAQARRGIPQGCHLHSLLAGGCRSIEHLLPGIAEDLRAAGAVQLIAGLSVRIERPGYDPFPARDLGFSSFSLSRPLLEYCVHRRVRATPNVAVQQDVTVERLLHSGEAIVGVQQIGRAHV